MNRTKIGINTAGIVLASTIIQSVLTLLRTRVILDIYGSSLNAVLQIAVQLSAYLLLFESGMSDAYRYYLYLPINNGDYGKISQLYHGLKKNMKDIAIKMLMVSLLVAFIYSLFLKGKGIAYFDALTILAIMGIRLTTPYYVTLPLQTMVIAKEYKYLVDFIQGLLICLSIVIEILLAIYTKLPLQLILATYIGLTFLTYPIYIIIVKKLYGSELERNVGYDDSPRKMTQDILVHQISGLVFNNTDNVLLSLFDTLNSVTIYSSFNTLIRLPITILTNIISGIRTSFALKVTSNDQDTYSVFKELLALEEFFIGCVIPVFMLNANDFVKLWIGEEFQLNQITIILFSLLLAHYLLMPALFAARDSKGLYRESKLYTFFQPIVKLAISVVLIKRMGINGLLIGALISTSVIVEPFTLALVYHTVFKKKITLYKEYGLILILCIISILFSLFLLLQMNFINNVLSWTSILIKAIIVFLTSITVTFFGLLIFNKSFKQLIKRMLALFFREKKEERNYDK